jgi:hypothetical protein
MLPLAAWRHAAAARHSLTREGVRRSAVVSAIAELGIIVRANGPTEQRVPCPRCGDGHGMQDGALGVNVDTGVFHCFRCGWKGCANSNVDTYVSPPASRIDDPAIAERKRERLRTTWRETVPLDHPKARAVCAYLEVRGLGAILKDPPAVLRAHVALTYYDTVTQRELGKFPAMVALFQSAAGTPCTLHATFLRSDGCAKAAVGSPKKVLSVPTKGATKGGAIRLYAPRNGVLGIAEGIESALSLHLVCGVPVWSSYCADNLMCVTLPAGLRQVYIGVDIDESGKGERVARALAKRLADWSPDTRVMLVIPDGDGERDLNDELRRRAI